MSSSEVFVGRIEEIKQFGELLAQPNGRVVLVAGASAMGKSVLLGKLAVIAESHLTIKPICLNYDITPSDDVDKLMLEIMSDCADAILTVRKGAKNLVNKNRQKIGALFSAGGVIPVVGGNIKALGDLLLSLAEESKKGNARQQLLSTLKALSDSLPEDARMVFFVDPEKLMPDKSADTWRLVMKELPDKMVFVFAQRQEDQLVSNDDFCSLENVVRIPTDELRVLDDGEVNKLIEARRNELPNKTDEAKLREVIAKYQGHPYAIQAAINLVIDGTSPEELPDKPEPVKFALMQIKRIESKGTDAISLFEAYTIAEVVITDEMAAEVAGIDFKEMRTLLADPFIKGLLRGDDNSRRIYHIILADEITKKIPEADSKKYHGRVVSVYREMLKNAEEKQIAPSVTAVEKLAMHVLESEGKEAFLYSFINECTVSLMRLGMYQTFFEMTGKALDFVSPNSPEESMLCGNMGAAFRKLGRLIEAEKMVKKSLVIDQELGRFKGIAVNYGNLGNIYQLQDKLDEAEDIYKKAMEINRQLICPEGMANNYGNLGVIYLKRSDLDKAEEMINISLDMSNELGLLEHVAVQYANLGGVNMFRNKLDEAMKMYEESLKIDEMLGRLEGTATGYSNIGKVYRRRGEPNEARGCWEKSRDLFAKIGMPNMVEKVQGLIDSLKG